MGNCMFCFELCLFDNKFHLKLSIKSCCYDFAFFDVRNYFQLSGGQNILVTIYNKKYLNTTKEEREKAIKEALDEALNNKKHIIVIATFIENRTKLLSTFSNCSLADFIDVSADILDKNMKLTDKKELRTD